MDTEELPPPTRPSALLYCSLKTHLPTMAQRHLSRGSPADWRVVLHPNLISISTTSRKQRIQKRYDTKRQGFISNGFADECKIFFSLWVTDSNFFVSQVNLRWLITSCRVLMLQEKCFSFAIWTQRTHNVQLVHVFLVFFFLSKQPGNQSCLAFPVWRSEPADE